MTAIPRKDFRETILKSIEVSGKLLLDGTVLTNQQGDYGREVNEDDILRIGMLFQNIATRYIREQARKQGCQLDYEIKLIEGFQDELINMIEEYTKIKIEVE